MLSMLAQSRRSELTLSIVSERVFELASGSGALDRGLAAQYRGGTSGGSSFGAGG
jgi:hypothetical protein